MEGIGFISGCTRSRAGANTVRQCLEAGLIDELQIHLAPIVLGDGVPLFEHTGTEHLELENRRVIDSPKVIDLRYHLVKED
jgi:dihydrofolate reductase